MKSLDTKIEDRVDPTKGMTMKKTKQQLWREAHPDWDQKGKEKGSTKTKQQMWRDQNPGWDEGGRR